MISLLLDSSNVDLCVGIIGEGIQDFTIYEAWQTQSEYMIQEIDKLLTKHSLTKDDIRDIIVTIGPGSYTGVRISLTIAKVASLALNIPLYTVSSLHVLKKDEDYSICLMNARSARSYIGVYKGSECILKDQVMKNEDVLKYINEHPDYVVCGDTKYLNIEGHKSNVLLEMYKLKDSLKKYDDALGVNPVYLKD